MRYLKKPLDKFGNKANFFFALLQESPFKKNFGNNLKHDF